VIDVRQPSKAPDDNAEALLLGHSANICALDVDPAGKFIVSGSWDSEARLWPVGKWECETVFKGHGHAVWAVLAYNSDTIITASADQKIRVFSRSGKLLREFQASDSPVRALARLSNNPMADFASADNAGVIRLWKISGQQVAELRGHDSVIYSLASLPSGELVSSGEDRTVRIWKENTCIQTITHPAISVWSVAACAETGDVVSGASDNVVRVFTRRQERFADAEATRFFDEAVKSSAIPQQALPEINKETLPGPEFLIQKAGTKDGQVQMIKEANGSITAHTWSVGKRDARFQDILQLITSQHHEHGSMLVLWLTQLEAVARRYEMYTRFKLKADDIRLTILAKSTIMYLMLTWRMESHLLSYHITFHKTLMKLPPSLFKITRLQSHTLTKSQTSLFKIHKVPH